ncbi:DUF2868 domain-containing protein [Neisseria chenwenguii]|uniref:Uncharacterized protein n=1 Tax=Neisseria chenwenguii TaxID=1853278 RepID=A0A220S047_9NEIS|nr:DUF2868 domain-containing protein [Neisseria chenwenguii]ASK26758.1 hypothetical protein BG910_02480 [Neisseria chenwenguii]ROV56420.1 DUF2868 domain-containing protein [Neisseria chenwenguii]
MLNRPRKLAELVRILEERGYIFPADPVRVGESLHHIDGGAEEKIIRRAQMLDRNGLLQDTLARAEGGVKWLWVFAAALVFTSGFSATYLLMENQGLNFFLLLTGVLGMNTLMLFIWLASVCLRLKSGTRFSSPSTWLRGKDPVNQAVLRLYADEWQQPATRWLIGATSHSLWLSTLFGMLVSVLLLLLVRQYTFNWESTLLSNAASVGAVEWLSWLPAKSGFPVPDAQAVLQGRLNSNTADARAWSGLLLGSIVCYGILPRFFAWLVCKILLKTGSRALPLDKPYYQNIIRGWQNKITDADTQRETVAAVAPKIAISDAPKWAVMLETEWPDSAWFRHALGQDWLDKGCADSRDRVAALTAKLQANPAQLLIGVRADTVPDRGVLRQIVQLAEAAQGGAVVQLLSEQPFSDGLENSLTHWHAVLAERKVAWLNPPRAEQEMRLGREKAV